MTASRKETRQALAQLLTNEVTSAKKVYAFQKGQLKGVTPVICVTGAGSARGRLTLAGSAATFTLDIHSFVLYSDGGTWFEEQAEDRLDELEQQISAVIDKYAKSTSWARLTYADRSDARTPVTLGGTTYLHEVIPVDIQVYS